MDLIFLLIQVLIIIAIAPLFEGIAAKLRARIQSKQGSSIFQIYRDIFKLLKRSRTAPNCTHWIFNSSAFLLFGISCSLLAAMPITYSGSSFLSSYSDIFLIIYLGAMFRFVYGIAGLDSGNPFAGVSASREQMIGIYVEPVLIVSLIVIMLSAKTTSLPEISAMLQNGSLGYATPSFAIAAATFLWAMYVETGRRPYDLAEAEQELQEGLFGEFSGRDLALAHLALIIKQFAMIAFFLSIFASWNFSNPFLALIVFLLKAFVLYIGAVLIDNFGARFRIIQGLKKESLIILVVSLISFILFVLGV